MVPVGEGVAGAWVNDMLEYNGELVVAGFYTSFLGHPHRNLVAWDGGTGFNDLGNTHAGLGHWVNDVIEYQGDLIIAGRCGSGIDSVMRWNGTSATMMGGVFNGEVYTLAIHGGELYAGGAFSTIGGIAKQHVVRWDGAVWQQVGNGLSDVVRSLVPFNGELYAGGDFGCTALSPDPPHAIARFDGVWWNQVADGLNDRVHDMLHVGNELFIAGVFDSTATGVPMKTPIAFDGAGFYSHNLLWEGNFSTGRLFQLPGSGDCYSDDRGTWCFDGGSWRSNTLNGLRVSASFQALLYGAGDFVRPSCSIAREFAEIHNGTDHAWLHPSLLNGRINPSNAIFQDHFTGDAGMEAPVGSGRYSLFTHGIVVAGKVNDSIHVSTPGAFGQDPGFIAGPWAIDTGATFCRRYYQVWEVDQGMIWDHEASWTSPGYVPANAIATWPGNGDTSNGEPAQVAPFDDENGNGLYEPSLGESPRIRGESAVYYVMSDMESLLNPTGVDVHVLVSGYNMSASDLLNNTILLNYKIVNRSLHTYDTLRIGTHVDPDIGCATDDYNGCDTSLSLGFGYNGDPVDESGCAGVLGYGDHPSAIGLVSLSTELTAFRILGNSSVPPNPYWEDANGSWYTLSGLLPNGTAILDPDSLPTKFMLPGDPETATGWTESSSGNDPNDRRFITSYGPFFNFAPGDTICLDLAFVFAQDSAGDNLSSVTLLKQRVQQLRDWYDTQALDCDEYPVLGVPGIARPVAATITVAPNPASEQMTITLSGQPARYDLEVLDLAGTVVHRQARMARSTVLDLRGFAPGVYVVRASGAAGQAVGRFVKVK